MPPWGTGYATELEKYSQKMFCVRKRFSLTQEVVNVVIKWDRSDIDKYFPEEYLFFQG